MTEYFFKTLDILFSIITEMAYKKLRGPKNVRK